MDTFALVVSVISALIGETNPLAPLSCGVDNSKTSIVYEGLGDVRDYPWMGTYYYQTKDKKLTTAVVLVSKQAALTSAGEIDKLPKKSIRRRSRVVLGESCDGHAFRIRDYVFHPDYATSTYSAMVLLQLEVDVASQALRPICPPPTVFINPTTVYSMTISSNCKEGKVHIRKMVYVDKEQCTDFYRRSGLDMREYWPRHTACARALTGGRCVWLGGTALVVKQRGHWRLLGFGIYGPGCEAPARFLDYGMNHDWVKQSITRIGQPAITRVAENHLIMRRTMGSVQRFGPCDPEETKYELYIDEITIEGHKLNSRAVYNLTLIRGAEYSCISFRAKHLEPSSGEDQNPSIYLRRWCAGPPDVCYGFQNLEIHFYVEIVYSYDTSFSVKAYGKVGKALDPMPIIASQNRLESRVEVPKYKAVQKMSQPSRLKSMFRFFFKEDVEDTNYEPTNDHEFLTVKNFIKDAYYYMDPRNRMTTTSRP